MCHYSLFPCRFRWWRCRSFFWLSNPVAKSWITNVVGCSHFGNCNNCNKYCYEKEKTQQSAEKTPEIPSLSCRANTQTTCSHICDHSQTVNLQSSQSLLKAFIISWILGFQVHYVHPHSNNLRNSQPSVSKIIVKSIYWIFSSLSQTFWWKF